MVSEYRFKVAIRGKGSLEFMNLHGRYTGGEVGSVKIHGVRSERTTLNNMYYSCFFFVFIFNSD